MTKYSGHLQSCRPQSSTFLPLQRVNPHGSPWHKRCSMNKRTDGTPLLVVEDFGGRSSLGTMDMTTRIVYPTGVSSNWPHVWQDILAIKRTRIGPTSPTTGSFILPCSQANTSFMTAPKWPIIAPSRMSSSGLITSAPTSWVPQTCGITYVFFGQTASGRPCPKYQS